MHNAKQTKTLIILAFFAVYVFWGGTYLGMKFALESFPPFIMAGIRHFTAGMILTSFAYFKKETNTNVITNQHIEEIMKVFANKENVDHFAKSVDLDVIAGNSYNLSVSSYVDAKDNREVVDIAELNAELKTTVAKIDALRSDIDAIVAEIEGEEVEA